MIQEFLYRDIYFSGTKQWVSVPHRVARKTRKYVYVKKSPYSPDDLTGGWLDGENPTFLLDRRALEQEGYAFIPAAAYVADTEEPVSFRWPRQRRMRWDEGHIPNCLWVLKLSWPCTVAEVKEAYRSLVKQAHPDGGGTHDEFLALQEAYEQARRMCR